MPLLCSVGSYVAEVVKRNMHSFRIFSPDEITSNKLDESLKVTHRNFQWDPETAHDGGRVTEMLSEHTLQGWLQGYTLSVSAAICAVQLLTSRRREQHRPHRSLPVLRVLPGHRHHHGQYESMLSRLLLKHLL